MKVDPLISLACSMESKKGVYALLLGSGVSRVAGIPTGWEITLEIVKKIAVLEGEKDIEDPHDWYKDKFGCEPDYSEIIKIVAKTQSERSEIIKPFFEPDENSDDKDKKPSKAHVAIAKMIKDGYIRVIITTNFDKLLEQALSDEGITPTVISNIDQLKGATPLIHSSCTIVKVHGDYMDNRIKNTEEELSEYDTEMNEYLDRIFDEFGLIVCGWSADWDKALRDSIYRCKNNRYTTYWLKKDKLSKNANDLVSFKKAEIINIHSADSFFTELLEKLESLNELSLREAPLSIDLACATLKRLLPDTKNVIRINDMIIDETNRIVNYLEQIDIAISPEDELVKEKIEQIEAICEKLLHMTAIGCLWSNDAYDDVWFKMFKALTHIQNKSERHYYEIWKKLCRYPAFLTMYVILISCISSKKYNLLYKILNEVKSENDIRYKTPFPVSIQLNEHFICDNSIWNKVLFNESKMTPLSERGFEKLRAPIFQIVNNENEYDILFDKAEYFYSIFLWCYNANVENEYDYQTNWAPFGRFGWKVHGYGWKFENYWQSELSLGENWEAIKAGFFNGSFEIFEKCYQNMNKNLRESARFF